MGDPTIDVTATDGELANEGLGIGMAWVLIVEDDEQVRVLAEAILSDAGYQTLTAATRDEAVALIAGDAGIDLLFTDIGLMDELQAGLQVAKEAAEQRPGLPVLYTTGQSITDGMRAIFVARSNVLAKPYTPDELVNTVAKLLQG